jgi:signal transduction histidine kinase
MRFDDRLSTVLRKPVTGDAIARIQYRQLLDLLGTTPTEAHTPQIDAAYLRLAELSRQIPATERAAMLGEPLLRLRNPRLVAQLAEDEPGVATEALASADLGEEQWLDLIPALPIRAHGIVRHRRTLPARVEALLERLGVTDRGLPPAAMPPAAALSVVASPPAPPPPQPAAADESIDGIGAIVRRIEQFRRTRQQQEEDGASGEAPRLPLGDLEDRRHRPLELFDFATDVEGQIVWSDPAAAAMVVGFRLATRDADSPAQASAGLVSAFRQFQPIRGERLELSGAPAIAGVWEADAAPRFDQPGGRFAGYCGRMRRPAAGGAQPSAKAGADSGADRMRQILHELRTPVNAIQGFAEVIQQQLFSPTPHEYRALAAAVASDSARILAGFDELERLVKLDSGAVEIEAGSCDLAAVLATTIAQLEPYCGKRGGSLLLEDPAEAGPVPVAMARGEAERLAWRLLATLAGAAAPGEAVRLKLRAPRDGMARLTLHLPMALAARDDDALFHATAAAPPPPQALSAGMFGTGFALRLAAAEACAAGGLLERHEGKLRLSLPEATATAEALDAPTDLRGNS